MPRCHIRTDLEARLEEALEVDLDSDGGHARDVKVVVKVGEDAQLLGGLWGWIGIRREGWVD